MPRGAAEIPVPRGTGTRRPAAHSLSTFQKAMIVEGVARNHWMHMNFTDHSRVTELGDSDSYATRLYDYARTGRDQIRWVIDRLAANPSTRDATISRRFSGV